MNPRVITELEISHWVAWLKASGRPASTIQLRTYHVRRTFNELGMTPWEVQADDLVHWLAAHEWAPETRRAYRASLRGFYTWAQASGRRVDSPAHLLPTVRLPRGLPRPTPDIGYRHALAQAPDRERLMVRLGAQCGLRRGEISRGRREDVEPDLVGYSLRVRGKGDHVRMVPLPNDLAEELLLLPPGWFFPSPTRPGAPLTAHHVGKLVSQLLPEGYTCHTLRHRCATVAYQQTRDLRAVQELLGHAKPETTARYTQVPQDAIRAAVAAAAA